MVETKNTSIDIFEKYIESAERTDPIKCVGKIVRVQGLLIESRGPQAIIGEVCRIIAPKANKEIIAEVVGLHDEIVQLMPYDETDGLEIGDRVIALGSRLEVPVSQKLLGRVLNALGQPIDDKGDITSTCMYPALASPPDPLKRKHIKERMTTGVRAIDGLRAIGKGQRIGIFAGSGIGKSTLLGMIARNTSADVNVVALIGERGREVNDFIDNNLGPQGLAKSVLVVTPGNSPPLSRIRGAYVATAIAEYFRDQGLDVMLFFDSVTRYARAMREIGLATGEPSAQKGFPPSMFDSMPKLLERSGTSDKGSITGFYTVLVDGDDLDEPVTDTVRGILDGHIVLSRQLQEANHYPPIDVLKSISRLEDKVSGSVSQSAAGIVRKYMADYARVEDFINAGAYRPGSNPSVDTAIAKHDLIEEFLIQGKDEPSSLEDTLIALSDLADLEIPPEEMIDKNAKIITTKVRKEKKEQAEDNAFNSKDNEMALKSVASLFSSFSGYNVLEDEDSGVSNENNSIPEK